MLESSGLQFFALAKVGKLRGALMNRNTLARQPKLIREATGRRDLS